MHPRSVLTVVAISASSLLGAPAANAITLPAPQGIYDLSGINVADHPELAGTTIYSTDVGYYSVFHTPDLPFGVNVTAAGTIHVDVIKETASGTLDYYYSDRGFVFPNSALEFGHEPLQENIQVDYTAFPSSGVNPRILVNNFSFTVLGATDILIRTPEKDLRIGGGTLSIGPQDGLEDLLIPFPAGPIGGNSLPEPASLTLLPLALTALAWRTCK